MPDAVLPFPKSFPQKLDSYYEQIGSAIKGNKHHDTRRHLFLNFLHEAFGIEPTDVELENKVKVGDLRGRIDALFRHVIVEVKSSFDAERSDAERELTKYFASRARPRDYIGIVTDGLRLEAWHLNFAGKLVSISTHTLRADYPLQAWRWLDQFLSSGIRRIPTSDELVLRFGTDTAIFAKAFDQLLSLYHRVEKEPLVAVKFREWNALLAKVYGSPLGKPDLFINHTYLAFISRIIVTLGLRNFAPEKKSDLRGLLDGSYFARQLNLKNLAEPDFFSWALDTEVEGEVLDLVRDLFAHCRIFDFSQLSEDVLKNLYQALIDPETRHDLGEYYTPDWLAELTLERLGYKGGLLLDPACGSGGFIFAAVHALRRAGLKGDQLVARAVEDIIGIDVHPVAVLMTKANLLLALRDELSVYSGDVTLRIYMADVLMAEEAAKHGRLTIPVKGQDAFHIPLATIESGELDELIDFLSDFAHRGSKDEEAEEKAKQAVENRIKTLIADKEAFYWRHNFRLMLKLDKQRRNTIWAYILKNAYRPEFLRREKVDYVAGNPPWLSYRYIKDESYKARVKSLTFEHELLGRDEMKLFTQMDTSTLFVAHCEREFLKPGGALGMVLQKTVILPAKQHLAFQRKGFTEVHDFTGVEPLFNVRTCMIIRRTAASPLCHPERSAERAVEGSPSISASGKIVRDPSTPLRSTQDDKGGKDTCETYGAANVPRFSWSGKLPARNLSLREARKILTSEEDTISFDHVSGEYSPYFDRFLQGATLVPRCLCFIEPVKDAALNLKAPFVRTSTAAFEESKKEWRLQIEGKIESKFLFGSLLAKDLVPFVVRRLLLVALPVAVNSHHDLTMVDSNEVLSQGHKEAHDWFSQAEREWEKGRKDLKMRFGKRLNYTRLLTSQELRADFIVLYNAAGTNLVAAMLTHDESKHIGRLPIQGFIAEHKTYRYYAASEEEAHYLVGVLNSPFVNEEIKPFQTQGLMGERDIERRPFEACDIPLFDPANKLHRQIAEVSAAARKELLPIVPKLQLPVAGARKFAREHVAGKLNQLDALTRDLLGSAAAQPRRKAKTDAQAELL